MLTASRTFICPCDLVTIARVSGVNFPDDILQLDAIKCPTVIGHIVGGIQSTLPNPHADTSASAASPFIFKVTLIPNSKLSVAATDKYCPGTDLNLDPANIIGGV